MLYHDVSLISIFGLRGTLYVQTVGNAEGVSVQTEGPYEAEVVDGSWLRIYPEDPELGFSRQLHTDITPGGTHLGSVDVTTRVRLQAYSRPRVRARTPVSVRDAVRITAPPSTKFELIRCYGRRKGPRGWHLMRGNDRFYIRSP